MKDAPLLQLISLPHTDLTCSWFVATMSHELMKSLFREKLTEMLVK